MTSLPHISHCYLLIIFVSILGCGSDSEDTTTGTDFVAPDWLLSYSEGQNQEGTDEEAVTIEDGIHASIDGVSDAFGAIDDNVNVIENDVSVIRILSANDLALDGETTLTMTWTLSSTVDSPATFDLVAGTQLSSVEESIFFYQESTTTSAIGVTEVTQGTLELEQWSSTLIRGTFSANLLMSDGSTRSIADGTIEVDRDS